MSRYTVTRTGRDDCYVASVDSGGAPVALCVGVQLANHIAAFLNACDERTQRLGVMKDESDAELLATLQRCRDGMAPLGKERLHDGEVTVAESYGLDDLLDEVDAVLAKARGEASDG